jgi:hypothetical protein
MFLASFKWFRTWYIMGRWYIVHRLRLGLIHPIVNTMQIIVFSKYIRYYRVKHSWFKVTPSFEVMSLAYYISV